MEEQTNVWDWDQEIEWLKQREENQIRADKVKNEEILDISKVERVESKVFEFKTEKGEIRKVERKFYIFPDRTVLVPVSLHKKIVRFVDKLGKDIKVQVFVEGSGLGTRYDAVPILSHTEKPE